MKTVLIVLTIGILIIVLELAVLNWLAGIILIDLTPVHQQSYTVF